ncbi:MAG: hypothetical protein FWC21_07290 [Treponema sp.]|nr:hypothetical protein [Treponema sp.]
MKQKNRLFWLVLLIIIPLASSYAQDLEQFSRRYNNGALFYGMERYQEAAFEFRRAQELASNLNDWSQALYWVILSQMAYSDFGSALLDMEELERVSPASVFARDMVYHKARVFYMQGFFEEALLLFNRYNISTTDSDQESADRRAASFFWMGECLYSMGQFDEAGKFYAWVIGRYPRSPKIEASSYRLDLIKQKKIEAELLALLQWSHEESLRTSEEFQRTIRTYEHALNLYQRRILELTSADYHEASSVPITYQGESLSSAPVPESSNPPQPSIAANESQTPVTQVPSETRNLISNGSGDELIDRARQLENALLDILREHNAAGGGSR